MNEERKFSKFVDMLKKFEVPLPFTEVVTQMPLYIKFLKDVLTKKRIIGGDGVVSIRGEYSEILLNPMPEKLQDPGSFSILCTVGNVSIKRALCDLGASFSILPLPIAKKVGLHDMIPTSMTLQLADRSVQRPMGVIEDVPVKVGDFYIPADFIVLDIPEDQQTPIILGRPFLATGDVKISFKEGKLTFKVGGNVVEFSLTGAMSQPMFESVYSVDMLEEVIEDAKDKCFGEHLEEDYEALPPILDEVEGKNSPKVIVYTDHTAIKQIMVKKDAKPRLIHWVLLLQEFDVIIKANPGSENLVADHLSRLTRESRGDVDDGIPIDEWLPDDSILAITHSDPWYADIANYLSSNFIPKELDNQARKKLRYESRRYVWEDPFLYRRYNDEIYRRCVTQEEGRTILQACHATTYGGHLSTSRIQARVLHYGFY
ncbi:uncharacterized protein LOC141641514 [Silene latifolia]|uniref:uncharacterized protein LOC141641514 n=1 Tax=Silene latifolia TaxID=37657 RepID=UPI003D787D5D